MLMTTTCSYSLWLIDVSFLRVFADVFVYASLLKGYLLGFISDFLKDAHVRISNAATADNCLHAIGSYWTEGRTQRA